LLEKTSESLSLSAVQAQAKSTVVLAFSQRSQWPVWVAKVSTGSEVGNRLEREYGALQLLRPDSAELGAPIVLDWESQSSENGESACLVLSARPGFSDPFLLVPGMRIPSDTSRVEVVLAWLERLRAKSLLSSPEQQRGEVSGVRSMLKRQAVGDSVLTPLWERVSEQQKNPRLVPSHGDLRWENLLFQESQLSVLDWGRFGLRDPFYDLLSLFSSSAYFSGYRVETKLSSDQFLKIYFSETREAQYVQSVIATLKPSAEELGEAFYSFIADKVIFAYGRELDHWREIVRFLGEQGFPAPWTRVLTR
jgi:hypothetical protein